MIVVQDNQCVQGWLFQAFRPHIEKTFPDNEDGQSKCHFKMMIYAFIQPVQLLLQKYFWVSTIIVNVNPTEKDTFWRTKEAMDVALKFGLQLCINNYPRISNATVHCNTGAKCKWLHKSRGDLALLEFFLNY